MNRQFKSFLQERKKLLLIDYKKVEPIPKTNIVVKIDDVDLLNNNLCYIMRYFNINVNQLVNQSICYLTLEDTPFSNHSFSRLLSLRNDHLKVYSLNDVLSYIKNHTDIKIQKEYKIGDVARVDPNLSNGVYVNNKMITYKNRKAVITGISIRHKEKIYTLDIDANGNRYDYCHLLDYIKDTTLVECIHCENEHEKDDLTLNNGGLYCKNCIDELFFYCDNCEKYHDIDEEQHDVSFHKRNNNKIDGTLCDDCVNDVFTICSNCGDMLEKDYDEYGYYGNGLYCSDCFAESYGYCNDCGDSFCREDLQYSEHSDRDYCDGCYCGNNGDVHGYDYKPTFNYHGKGLHLGLELEVEFKNSSCNEVVDIYNEYFDESTMYLKEDGSLQDGLEFVTMPHTLKSFEDIKDKFRDMLKDLSTSGVRSHDTGTCGIHVHIDRRKMKPDQVAKLEAFFIYNKENIHKFSRRDDGSYTKIKGKDKLKDISRKQIANMIKKGYDLNSDRFQALNWRNRNTVELRCFKGTLKLETLYATLQFSDAIYNYTKIAGFNKIRSGKTWQNFKEYVVKNEKVYTELIGYLNELGL